MWTAILSLVIGGLPAIVQAIGQARHDSQVAETDKERIAADERVKALEAQKEVLLRESVTPWNAIARFTLLAPVALYFSWTIAWDKIACKWFFNESVCVTDPLSDWQNGIAAMIVGFYFLTDWTRIFKR
jgi:hypothetical protein